MWYWLFALSLHELLSELQWPWPWGLYYCAITVAEKLGFVCGVSSLKMLGVWCALQGCGIMEKCTIGVLRAGAKVE